jgi:hypothetical protein
MTLLFSRAQEPPNNPPAHLLTMQDAEERLKPYKELLEACIQHGWDEWNAFYAQKHHVLDPRARAAIVFAEIVALAEHKFCDLEGVSFKRRQNSFLLFIGDDIIIRFKKIRKNGACSSIDTRQQMLFSAQMNLPGIETGTILHAGYALDDLQREIARKLVVCQFKNQVLWTISLTGNAGESSGKIEILPTPSTPPIPTGPRWESKPADEKKKKTKVMTITAGKGN